ncbi:MAG: neutral/alkaline non-lysosomal ceramidase N-terminal domain-containing protein [Candidatus Latescibacteria bacterium]|nr:neutral/alkaline non-lysosomal ceramidase N-terminal domain-containing protein [Candidatus Latescibacterota bacterium]
MLKAGAAKVDITPFLGGPMAGYAGRDKGSEAVHDPLYAKALVLDDGRTKVALVTTDLIGVNRELAAETRDLVKKMVRLPQECVWLCGSHTHFGPEIRRDRSGDDRDGYDSAYAKMLPKKLASAVKMAHDSRRRARVGSGRINAEGISYNRRPIAPDGKAVMSLVLPAARDDVKFGPVDTEVGILKVTGPEEGDTIATLINFGCHPVSSTDRMLEITADYPGYAMDLIEQVEGGVCLFALGCAGNIVPIQRHGRSKRQVGLSLGGSALKELQWIATTDEARIRAGRKQVTLPVHEFPFPEEMERQIEQTSAQLERARKRNAPNWEMTQLRHALNKAQSMPQWAERFKDKDELDTEVQAFWIGDIPMVGLPGEVFTELGMQVKKGVGVSPTIVASLSNDGVGYVSIRKAYAQGGYEPNRSPLRRGAGEMLVKEAVALAESVRKKRGPRPKVKRTKSARQRS